MYYSDLKRDHDELRQIMKRFAAEMAKPEDSLDHALLRRERVAFSLCFSRHIASELDCVHRLSREDKEMASVIATYHAQMSELRHDYSAHVNSWSPAVIAKLWRGYVTAVLGLQRRLIDQMEWEERELYPAIARMETEKMPSHG